MSLFSHNAFYLLQSPPLPQLIFFLLIFITLNNILLPLVVFYIPFWDKMKCKKNTHLQAYMQPEFSYVSVALGYMVSDEELKTNFRVSVVAQWK